MNNVKIQISKILMIHLVLLAVLIGVGAYGYAKYWNVASANGVNISRIEFYKALEAQGGKQVLDQMVQEALIKSEAAKKGVTVDQKTVDAEIATISTKLKAQGMTLDDALKAQGMTKADLESQVKLQKMVTVLAAPKIEITQAQIDKFLTDNKAQLPKTDTKEQLQQLAKDQLTSQANSQAITTWLATLKSTAKIIYR